MAKVAEYQARGLVHFHATFRLDGPEPAAPLPAGATVEVLEEALREAATAAAIQHPASPLLAGRPPVVWGDQLDLRPVQNEAGEGTLSDGQVAGYIAKYATKGAEASGAVDRRLACRPCHGQGTTPDTGRPCQKCHGTGRAENAHSLKDLNPHIRRMIETCWDLGGRPEIEQLRLRPWAHMLGFRGHFSTKSRRYSTTLGCLRSARRTWQQQRTLAAHRLDPDTPVIRAGAGDDVHELIDQTGDDTVVVIGHWAYTGTGHTAGEAVFAATVAAELAESRHFYRQITRGAPSPCTRSTPASPSGPAASASRRTAPTTMLAWVRSPDASLSGGCTGSTGQPLSSAVLLAALTPPPAMRAPRNSAASRSRPSIMCG